MEAWVVGLIQLLRSVQSRDWMPCFQNGVTRIVMLLYYLLGLYLTSLASSTLKGWRYAK